MPRVLSCFFENNNRIMNLICTSKINFFSLYLDLTCICHSKHSGNKVKAAAGPTKKKLKAVVHTVAFRSQKRG